MMDLAKEIEKLLKTESKRINDLLTTTAEEVAEETVQDLKANSPKDTGKYSRSWDKKDNTRTGANTSYIVHNKRHYRLTHLLEFGHAKVNGGRVPAQVHIKPAEDRAIRSFEDRIRRGIRSG